MTPASTPENYLGFDFGTRRIGVAVGNALTATARGLTTIPNNPKPDWGAIENLRDEWQPSRIVVGLPLNMDGTEQPLTQAARKFAKDLQNRLQIPVEFMDERLSSVAALETLKEQRASGRKRRIKTGEKDSEAARVILQDWLRQS